MENYLDNPYLLLTPGPLSTSRTVRAAMGRDWCTWDEDYNLEVVQVIRRRLLELATTQVGDYTAILMQGSGTFSVEAALGTAVGLDQKVLILVNGAYGERMVKIARQACIECQALDFGELAQVDPRQVELALAADPTITHVAMVHGETTTGMLNPLAEVAAVVKGAGRRFIVDAMSTFGGMPMDIGELGIDFLVSSANKCIQGVPGFGFVLARREEFLQCRGNSPSLSLDLCAQWDEMEPSGKWRFTSPTHVVRAFLQALRELEAEGGIAARHARYRENHRLLVEGMEGMGFQVLLPADKRSVMITSFLYPREGDFQFKPFYQALKQRGFVIYPGKIGKQETFRIGTIGDVHPLDIQELLAQIEEVKANGYR